MRIATEIFGNKVKKPEHITNDIDFEYYSLDRIQEKANNFIERKELSREDIITYKVKLRRSFEKGKKDLGGGKIINTTDEVIFARIYLTYVDKSDGIDEN